jgi:hypothetical protein
LEIFTLIECKQHQYDLKRYESLVNLHSNESNIIFLYLFEFFAQVAQVFFMYGQSEVTIQNKKMVISSINTKGNKYNISLSCVSPCVKRPVAFYGDGKQSSTLTVPFLLYQIHIMTKIA